MMKAAILVLLMLGAALAGCAAASPERAGGLAIAARTDTADVLQAVWRSAASGHPVGRVTWLYLPESDTANLTSSAGVRRMLSQRGVRASTHLPVGHDTVVYRVRRWTEDADGAHLLQLLSRWTTLMGDDPASCRSAGNTETYRVQRAASGWSAVLAGPVAHGDGACETPR